MSLEFQHFLQRIAGRRTPQTPGSRSALHIGAFQIGRLDDPRRAFTELTRRELAILDQTAHVDGLMDRAAAASSSLTSPRSRRSPSR